MLSNSFNPRGGEVMDLFHRRALSVIIKGSFSIIIFLFIFSGQILWAGNKLHESLIYIKCKTEERSYKVVGGFSPLNENEKEAEIYIIDDKKAELLTQFKSRWGDYPSGRKIYLSTLSPEMRKYSEEKDKEFFRNHNINARMKLGDDKTLILNIERLTGIFTEMVIYKDKHGKSQSITYRGACEKISSKPKF